MSTAATPTKPTPERVGMARIWPVLLLALIISVICEVIGKVSIHVGVGDVVLFPMVWGILIGTLISLQRVRPLGLGLQRAASAVVTAAVMLLVARLAFNIGPNLDALAAAGPALLLQEVGHLLGTVGLALPLAVALRMGRSTIGATFSLDREPSFAIVSEKFGADSDEYRGVLAMYVFGTLFGAVYITLLASFITSTDVFDPLALAMGAGVGSGSMMAAATASIAAAHPGDTEAISAMAAVSNLLTTVLGVYAGIYLALPAARKLYTALTRGRGLTSRVERRAELGLDPGSDAVRAEGEKNRLFREQVAAAGVTVNIPWVISLPSIAVIGVATASVVAGGFSWSIVGGYLALLGLVAVSLLLGRVSRVVSPIIWITTLGALVSSPWSPIATPLTEAVSSVDLLSIATIMLTTAGLSLGKDIPLLRNIGWKIVPVGLVAITASFLLATVIAEVALGFWS